MQTLIILSQAVKVHSTDSVQVDGKQQQIQRVNMSYYLRRRNGNKMNSIVPAADNDASNEIEMHIKQHVLTTHTHTRTRVRVHIQILKFELC